MPALQRGRHFEPKNWVPLQPLIQVSNWTWQCTTMKLPPASTHDSLHVPMDPFHKNCHHIQSDCQKTDKVFFDFEDGTLLIPSIALLRSQPTVAASQQSLSTGAETAAPLRACTLPGDWEVRESVSALTVDWAHLGLRKPRLMPASIAALTAFCRRPPLHNRHSSRMPREILPHWQYACKSCDGSLHKTSGTAPRMPHTKNPCFR